MVMTRHQGVMNGENQTPAQAAVIPHLQVRKMLDWPLSIPHLPTDYDSDSSTPDNLAREKDMTVALWRSARVKWPAPTVTYVIIQSGGSVTIDIHTHLIQSVCGAWHAKPHFVRDPDILSINNWFVCGVKSQDVGSANSVTST